MTADLANGEPNATRASLLAAIQASPLSPRWEEFYDTYANLVRGVARSKGLSAEDAEDVAHETFASVVRALPRFEYNRDRCTFKTWLMRITLRRIADHFEKRSRQPATTGLSDSHLPEDHGVLEDLKATEDGFDEVWEKEWKIALAEAGLTRLKQSIPADQFRIFYLHCYRDQPAEVVAKTLEVSRALVYLTKFRLLPKFERIVRQLRKEWE